MPTNILKLAIAIQQEDADGMQQVIYYDPGVGTQGAVDKIVGGGLGEGIDVNIMELYTFLAMNYDDGDEVYLFGFSRGSYTIRSLTGMIWEAGLLRRDQIQFVKDAYELYRDNEDVESERAVAFREEHGGRVDIKLLACFDTVGSLGLPFPGGFLSKINRQRYGFHDTRLSPIIQNAIHILAIDEKNSMFKPTLMSPTMDEVPEQLTQTYCWGEHGGVGGGDKGQIINANTSLQFLVEEMKRRGLGLAVDTSIVPQSLIEKTREKVEAPKSLGENIMGAVIGLIVNVTGESVRKIESVDKIHPAAIKRYQELPEWRPPALSHLEEEILAFDKEKLEVMCASYDPAVWRRAD